MLQSTDLSGCYYFMYACMHACICVHIAYCILFIYGTTDGIPTGIAFGVLLANLYLQAFDEFIVDFYGSAIQWYFKFVDDVCMLTNVTDVISVFNAWHASIVWEPSGRSNAAGENICWVPFLDLELCINEKFEFDWRLFKKPQNLYLYVPRDSNHDESSFMGIIIGGIQRIHRRCKFTKNAELETKFFIEKLKERGFEMMMVRKGVSMALKHRERRRDGAKSFYYKCKFSNDVNKKWLRRRLNKHKSLLDHAFGATCKICIAWSVHKNMFRRLYGTNWSFTKQRVR